jgi:hypothetical protein
LLLQRGRRVDVINFTLTKKEKEMERNTRGMPKHWKSGIPSFYEQMAMNPGKTVVETAVKNKVAIFSKLIVFITTN